MAESTVSCATLSVNEIRVEITEHVGEQPAVLSTDVALRFQKKHTHVLRDIDRLRSMCPKGFFDLNFKAVEQTTQVGFGERKDRAYLLTRDAFSLLVMGFTGSAAIRWKLRYIEAFNALEAAALDHRMELAREAGYQQGVDSVRGVGAATAAYNEGYRKAITQCRRYHGGVDTLFRLRDYLDKGLTFAEAGKLLDMSGNAARKRYRRAERQGLFAAYAQTQTQTGPRQLALPGLA